MATGSYLTPNHSRSQSEIQGDLHNYGGYISYSHRNVFIKSDYFRTLSQSNIHLSTSKSHTRYVERKIITTDYRTERITTEPLMY
ncbi:hypothetical protein TNCV_87671 [Trichonephila clavipes]|nr:hypothetical protein TNCV_87671 [Trichonephila clavipes]